MYSLEQKLTQWTKMDRSKCQMISSGSLTLCKGYKVEQTKIKRKRVIGGGKNKDTYATDVECFSLSDVISKTLTHDVYH